MGTAGLSSDFLGEAQDRHRGARAPSRELAGGGLGLDHPASQPFAAGRGDRGVFGQEGRRLGAIPVVVRGGGENQLLHWRAGRLQRGDQAPGRARFAAGRTGVHDRVDPGGAEHRGQQLGLGRRLQALGALEPMVRRLGVDPQELLDPGIELQPLGQPSPDRGGQAHDQHAPGPARAHRCSLDDEYHGLRRRESISTRLSWYSGRMAA